MKIFAEKNLKQSSWLLNILIRISISYRSFFSYFKRLFAISYPLLIDLFLILAALLISIWLRFESFPIEAYTIPIIVYIIIWLAALLLSGSYKTINRFSIIKPFNAILAGFFVNSAGDLSGVPSEGQYDFSAFSDDNDMYYFTSADGLL